MKKSIYTYLLISLSAIGCATFNISHINLNKKTATKYPGITYALPKHIFDIVVNYEGTFYSRSAFLEGHPDDSVNKALKDTGVQLSYVTKKKNGTKKFKITSIEIGTRTRIFNVIKPTV